MTLVSKKADILTKEHTTGVIIRSITYMTENSNDKIMMIGNGSCIFPDVFELDLPDEKPINLMNTIAREVNNISFSDRNLLHCPFCKTTLHHHTKQLICFNVNCVDDDRPDVITYTKLRLIFDRSHDDFIQYTINLMSNQNIPITVVSVFKFIDQHQFIEDDDILSQYNFIIALSELTLSKFLHLIMGTDMPVLFKPIINFYNNQLISIVKDLPTVFEPLYSLNIPAELRLMLHNIFSSNKQLLECIIPEYFRYISFK